MMKTVEAEIADSVGFEWDENKRKSNLDKHYIDFEDAKECFENPMKISPSLRGSEQRYVALGVMAGRVVAVVFALRDRRIRIISVRIARKDEREAYHQSFPAPDA